MGRAPVGTFDVLTRLNVAGCGWALAAVVVAVGLWRAGLPAVAAVACGAVAGLGGAVVSQRRRGAAGHPLAGAALFAGWAALLGPIAWLAASALWPGV